MTETTEKWVDPDQLPTTKPECPPVHYDVGRQTYWIQNERGDWITVNDTSLRRHLRKHGFSQKQVEGEMLSPLDACFNDIQYRFDVAYAGPLAGYRKGLVEIAGQRILVTSSPKLIEAEQRPCPVLTGLIQGMFGDVQLPYFKAWLKIAFESLANDARRPGPVLVLAGPKDSYKSLLQNLITRILGGRSAKPYRYMSGSTDFNGDLFGAEHLMIEDEFASAEIRARRNFGARIKEFTVNEDLSCHAKNRQALTLRPFWRVTVSVNNEAENLMILPPLDDSLEDKLILLNILKQSPVMSTATLEARQEFMRILLDELPGFIWGLRQWPIPAEIQGGRFGVRHYHHPDLLQAIKDSAPETKLLALIDDVFKHGGFKAGFNGTAEDLEHNLTGLYPHEARRLFSWSNAAGTYLGRLADQHPERVKQRRTATERLWTVLPTEPVTA